MSAPPFAPAASACGPFPSDRPTTFTDGYGRSQVLVPIEKLQEAEARAQRASATADRLAADCDRLMAERDAARAESAAQRQSYAHLSAEFAVALTQLRETRDLAVWLTDEIGENADGATLIDLVRRYADEQCAASARPTVAVDHTDPEQIRRAAGVIEGIAMDKGHGHPHAVTFNAAGLRYRAEAIEAIEARS